MRLPFINRSQAKNKPPVEDDVLTEDPERQRARHRLIGAIFLVFVAFVGLPILFDSKPKQYNNDIAIQIIQPNAKDEKLLSDAKPEPKVEDKTIVDSDKKPEVVKEAKDTKETKEANKSDSKSDKAAPPVAKTLDKGEEVLSILEDRNVSKASTSKYIIQIGSFPSENRVKGWQSKLQAQKISTYVDTRNNKDGSKSYLLRAGPYVEKSLAEAAEKKIKSAGLSPKLVEQKPR
jgi:DedD protein